jgi:hypothetical protein
MHDGRRRWIATRATLAWLFAAWLLVWIVRAAAYGHVHGVWDWMSLVLLWLLTAGLILWFGLRVVAYAAQKPERFVRNFLFVGWVIALIFRLFTGGGVPSLVSFGLFWTFTGTLVAFFIWRRDKRRREH